MIPRRSAVALLWLLACVACSPAPEPSRPNILWIVWDTVRADRLGLYGHSAPTTPNLERWARKARVFDATSTSCWTIPAHASMFTGLYPSEHGMHRLRSVLAPELPTVASLVRDAGYETYLFSANPHLSARTGLANGFDVVESPHESGLTERAQQIVLSKLHPDDRSSTLRGRLEGGRVAGLRWQVKAVGELAGERFLHFLDSRDAERPFFAFLNYMEAHRVRIPPDPFRREVMTDEQVERSYTLFQGQLRMFEMSLGTHPQPAPEDVRVLGGVYDATIAELDVLLDALLSQLDERGLLDETVVVLTSDHGEHLGERGSWLHQYSLYEGVVRVPLVVWAPGRLEPGREDTPVTTLDLFPTLLELAGVDPPPDTRGVSLMRPKRDRLIVAEYPVAYPGILSKVGERHPEWDPTPYRKTLTTARVGSHKLVLDSTGGAALYDLSRDPDETVDLHGERPELAATLERRLQGWLRGLGDAAAAAEGAELSEEEKEQLRALGYL